MTTPGDFVFIDDEHTRNMLSLTYQAVTNTNSWDFMKSFTPEKEKGFMFTSNSQLNIISSECEKLGCGHSGGSWGFSMRTMEYIAKKGWENYVANR
jgi:hypothetical protein